jgi:cell wall assembly regulator SMI1
MFDFLIDPVERIKVRWASEGITIRPGASTEALDAFEARYGVVMPGDLRAYFSAVDGMDESDWDRDFCQFLPLDRCAPIAESEEDLAQFDWASRYFLLIDHSIEVFFYAVQLSPDPEVECPVILWDGTDRWACSPSFADFLQRYLADGALFQVGAKLED